MREAIENFPDQFRFNPEIQNEAKLSPHRRVIVCGMGGSHLAADILNENLPERDIWVWKDYGLPPLSTEELKNSLVIASSYSGNTAETLDAYVAAQRLDATVAVLTAGGQLLDQARRDGVPFVILPDTGVQPRSALGLSTRGLLALIGEGEALQETSQLSDALKPKDWESSGRELAGWLKGYVPVIYASRRNWPLAYNWKIKFNETSKIPAFANHLPEMNHNEMNGFDVQPGNQALTQNFSFVFLRDPADDPRVVRRMDILEQLYIQRHLPVRKIDLDSGPAWQKIFANLLLADWAAFYTAEQYGLEPEAVPMVEEMKRLLN